MHNPGEDAYELGELIYFESEEHLELLINE